MFVYGKNSFLEILNSGKNIKKVFLREGLKPFGKDEALQSKMVFLPREEFDKKFPEKCQGIVTEIDFKIYDFDEVSDEISLEKNVVVLEHIQDPHNFGAIVRAGHCFGINYFIVAKDNQAPVSPTVFKTSAGSLVYSKIVEVVNIAKTLDKLKDLGFFIFAADVNGDATVSNILKYGSKNVIIIGSEGEGIRPNVLKRADIKFKIPMSGKIDSLNAAQSASIIFYELSGLK